MSFTLYSVAVLLALATSLLVEILRGIKKGFLKTAIRMGTVIGSILISLPLSLWAGDIPSTLIANALMSVSIVKRLADSITGLGTLVAAYVDAILSPILFLILFFVIRAILSLVVSIVCKKKLGDSRHDAGYVTSEDAWYYKHNKLYGALMGALVAFVMTVCVLSPVTGTLRIVGTAADCAKTAGVNMSKMGIPEQYVTIVDDVAHDAPSSVLYACGGELMYKATASFELEGTRYALADEIGCMADAWADIRNMLIVFRDKKAEMTAQDKQSIEHLKGAIETSGTVKFVTAGFMNEASETWLEGGKYLGVGRPSFGKVVDPMVSEILIVCSGTDTNTISADMSTLLNIYVLTTDHGMISNPDYQKLVSEMGEGTLLDDICDELEANPRMAYIADMMTDMIVRTVSSAINLSDAQGPEYEKLLVNLADSLNSLKDESDEVKVTYMTNYIVQYADDYGVELPDNMATVTAQYMVEEIDSSNGDVTNEQIREFLDRHSVDGD